MATSWEVAAVLGPVVLGFVTLLLTYSPGDVALLQQWFRKLAGYLWPSKGKCGRLLWGDINEGQLVFNQLVCLLQDGASSLTGKKPYQLPLSKDYIQTDLQTLKAFIMLTADACRSCERLSPDLLLDVRTVGPIATVKTRPPARDLIIPSLSKFEVDKLIEGYPPFYRAKYRSTGGVTFDHPITDTDQMRHGAWILAVGMTLDIGAIPSLHNLQRISDEKFDSFWQSTVVMSAFRFLKRTLGQLQTFEETRRDMLHRHGKHQDDCKELWTQHAFTCYHMILDPTYSSQPQTIQTENIETTKLFEPLIGDHACSFRCLDPNPHL
jgi:hypothetical protein